MGKPSPSRMDPRWKQRRSSGASAGGDQPWSEGAKVNYRFTALNLRTDHLWPGITNPVIREVLTTAYRTLPRDTYHGIVFDNPEYANQAIIDYQLWLSRHLPSSGLAKALAGGLDQLPDATADLPQPWKYLARRFGPRNYRQLTRAVMFNLEWYVAQTKKPRDPWTVLSDICPGSFWIIALFYPTLMLTTSIGRLPWLTAFGVFLAVWAILLLVLALWGFDAHKHRTNCAEFYHYLVKEYTDVEFEDPNREYELKIDEKFWLSPIDTGMPDARRNTPWSRGG